ncbi:MAG TPA: aminopeptidase P family protein [Armatimonadota bacterium]|nr:aminopeptidase P family protein [Armatimonadota bacterium]
MKAAQRAQRLRDRFEELEVDAALLTAEPDAQYVSGFSGEGWVIVDEAVAIVTDGRYDLRAEREAPGCEIIIRSGDIKEPVKSRLVEKGAKRVAFQADQMTVSAHAELAEQLEGIELVPAKAILKDARMLKDEDEIDILRRAIAATDQALEAVVADLRLGMSEKEASLEVQRQLLLAGGDKLSFPTIAAFGPNSADPHAEPSDRTLAEGDNVKLDFGAAIQNYCADLTRTVFISGPDDKQREIYNIVLDAQLQATAACKPGAACKDVDGVAREIIKEAGYGDYFTHGLGHGVGLQIHEAPGLGHTSEDTLAAGMVVTIEPGIYIKEWGGVRIEDCVLITEDGHEVLTKAAKLNLK